MDLVPIKLSDMCDWFHAYLKKRAQSSQCCGLALSLGVVLHTGLTSLHLSPLDKIVQEKKKFYDYNCYFLAC